VTSALPKNPDHGWKHNSVQVLPKEEMHFEEFSSHAGRWWPDLKSLFDDGLCCDEACLGDCCSCCCGLRHGKRMKRQEDSLTSSNASTLSSSDHAAPPPTFEVRLERGGEPQSDLDETGPFTSKAHSSHGTAELRKPLPEW
jgi:hypothetical protein